MWRVILDPRLDKSEFGDFDTYMRMCEESGGFDVCRLIRPLSGGIVEVEKFKPKSIERATEVAKFAVDQHNTHQLTSIASRKWRSMSVREKVRCYHLRNLKYEDVAEFVPALQNEVPGHE